MNLSLKSTKNITIGDEYTTFQIIVSESEVEFVIHEFAEEPGCDNIVRLPMPKGYLTRFKQLVEQL